MTEFTHLIKEAETDPSTGQITNASTGGQVPLVELAIWNAESLQRLDGESYATIAGAIRHGLRQVRIPVVGGPIMGDPNAADRAGELATDTRSAAYNIDHTGGVVNPAVEGAYKNRTTTQELITGIRELGSCLKDGCFVHPVHRTTTCGQCHPSGIYGPTGDIATAFHRVVSAGLWNEKKVAELGMVNGEVAIIGSRVLRKRSGAGKSGGSKAPAYRYGTTCPTSKGGCGRSVCWGSSNGCGTDNEALFTFVDHVGKDAYGRRVELGREMTFLNRRADDFDTVVEGITQDDGVVVIHSTPFINI